jgi:diadenosine tetraphosphatase ApaH/serine/threonine PP2A family protein phosphatase
MAELIIPETNQPIKLMPRTIINPGSVGQPRDRDPRASFAIYIPETQTWENYRISYDIQEVQARMVAAHLPERHIVRLEGGW